MAAEQRNGPGIPKEAAPVTALKSIAISGTNLFWIVGAQQSYLDKDGKTVPATISGIATVVNPQQPGFEQVVILFVDGYRDYFVVADHLIVRNLHVSELVVPVTKIEV